MLRVLVVGSRQDRDYAASGSGTVIIIPQGGLGGAPACGAAPTSGPRSLARTPSTAAGVTSPPIPRRSCNSCSRVSICGGEASLPIHTPTCPAVGATTQLESDWSLTVTSLSQG